MNDPQVILPPPEPDEMDEYRPMPEEVIFEPAEDAIPSKGGRLRRVIFSLLSLLLVLSMCLGVGGTAAIDEIRQYFERREMSAVLNHFMLAMAQGDAATAYIYMSEDFQGRVSYRNLEAMLYSDEYLLFEGYRNLDIKAVTITTRRDGSVRAQISGILRYEGDFKGEFSAHMIEEGDEWRLLFLNIHIPPEKRDAEGRSV